MNSPPVRRAIAKMFPESYRFWNWRSRLLSDFVDIELKALTVRWLSYQRRRQLYSDPGPEPTLSPVVQQAVVMLVKRQRLPYSLLALSHYVHLHQHGALMVDYGELLSENQRLQGELGDAMGRLEHSEKLSKLAVAHLEVLTDPDPDNRPN